MTSLPALYGFLDAGSFCTWVAKTYGLGDGQFMNDHRIRRETIAQRLRLYRDDCRIDMERMIGKIFVDAEVQAQRKKMVEVASGQNVTRRIVDEVASLYDQPAVRMFKDDVGETERFRAMSDGLELDEVFQEAHRLTFLCNEVLLWLVDAIAEGEPQSLRIITPDAFDAIPHPKNQLLEAGFLIDACPAYVPDGSDRAKVKHYEIWDAEFTYDLNADGQLIEARQHLIGRIPGVLFHRRKPVDRILDARSGTDITSTHLGVGLLEVMIMRLSKSQGERQPTLTGDLARMASGQSMDGERPMLLPPGVVAAILEMKTTPDHYILAKKDQIGGLALTYGMSYEQYSNTDTADTQSGKAFQVRRLKLTELRNEQRRRARVHEKAVAKLLGFNPAKLRVDHREQTIPQDAVEEVALLQVKMRLGLDSIVLYVMRKNPDLSRDEALQMVKDNLRDWAVLVMQLRALNMPGTADAAHPGQSPAQNGAANNGANDGSGTPQSAFLDVRQIERGQSVVAA